MPAGGFDSPLPGGSGHLPAGTMTGPRGARWTGTGGGQNTRFRASEPGNKDPELSRRGETAGGESAVECRKASAPPKERAAALGQMVSAPIA